LGSSPLSLGERVVRRDAARVVRGRRSAALLGAFVIAHLMLISHQVDGGEGLSLLQRIVLSALSPFQQATAGAYRFVGDVWRGYFDLRDVRQENDQLRTSVRDLQVRLHETQARAREAARLRQILDLRQLLPGEPLVAEVIARDGLPWFRTLTLNKGTSQGVKLNSPVVCPSGVVGRVIAVGPQVARVQLLWDRDSGVGARVERSRVTGVVSGQIGVQIGATPTLLMKYVPLQADVVPGDVVVTSGLDQIYPKGLVLGRVDSIVGQGAMFKEMLLASAARLDELEEVLVLGPLETVSAFTESVR